MSTTQPPDLSDTDLLKAFIAGLETLLAGARQSGFEGRSLQKQFLATQQLYQQQLLPTLVASAQASALVTYQTEINRSLRLLGMDVSFLQSAKNPMTQQKRQTQMQQRLKTLLEFSRGLLDELTPNDAAESVD